MIKQISKFIFSFFLKKEILTGRWFHKHSSGYLWAARTIWQRNILHLAPRAPWPIALGCTVSNFENIEFDPDDLNNFQSNGTYFQNFNGKIFLGKGTHIAPNVGIITSNHDIHDLGKHTAGKDVHIGENCWIGMNSVILPGTLLGPHTIVAAGSVVSKAFPQGHIIIGGVPAKVLKAIEIKDAK
jgi:acetyltransferase-like isoleucine patch superfamily enzyme